MVKNKETFSEQVKKEIISLEFENHCMKALLSSFITNKMTVVLNSNRICWRLTSQFPFIINFLEHNLKLYYPNIHIEKSIDENATNINGLTNYIDISGDLDYLEKDLYLNENWDKKDLFDKECCKRSYVAGAFLACGSVNSPKAKSYHLELRSNNYLYLCFLQALLTQFDINAVLTRHATKQFFLYIKKADQISDFLRLICAGNAMLEFEDEKISKDFNMQITRLNNLDISNINKSTQAGVKQVNQIKKLINTSLYAKQKPKFKFFCQLRLNHPDSSLSELVELMEKEYRIKITKGGLNHFVRKLNELEEK